MTLFGKLLALPQLVLNDGVETVKHVLPSREHSTRTRLGGRSVVKLYRR